MSALVKLFNEKYGGESKEARGGLKNMPPEVRAKFEANKGKPGAAPGGKKPAKGEEKKAAEIKVAEYQGGKVASAAFFDELEKLNAADADALKQAQMRQDPLIEKIRGLA